LRRFRAQYKLHSPFDTPVWLKIRPLSMPQAIALGAAGSDGAVIPHAKSLAGKHTAFKLVESEAQEVTHEGGGEGLVHGEMQCT
jgi:hypothetical protein